MKRHDCSDPLTCLKCKKAKYQLEWRNKNKEYTDDYQKKYNLNYYTNNKDKIIAQTKDYYENNKEAVSNRKKEYHKENLEYFRNRSKKYWEDNKEILKEKNTLRYMKNKKRYNQKHYLTWKKPRYLSDPVFRLKECLSSRIRGALKYTVNKKDSLTVDLVGCSIDDLKVHLEKNFFPGMSWDNYGAWHIDHIVPCDSFDLSDPVEQKKCFHYSNLRPYWAKDNIRKSTSLNYLSDAECCVLMSIF